MELNLSLFSPIRARATPFHTQAFLPSCVNVQYTVGVERWPRTHVRVEYPPR